MVEYDVVERVIVMTDAEFLDAAEKVLNTIEACCDDINAHTDADIDNLRNGNALTLVFSNHTQIVVNLQKPLHEIWVAAPTGGYHFQLSQQGIWHDTREGLEFYSALSGFASQQSGISILFCEK